MCISKAYILKPLIKADCYYYKGYRCLRPITLSFLAFFSCFLFLFSFFFLLFICAFARFIFPHLKCLSTNSLIFKSLLWPTI